MIEITATGDTTLHTAGKYCPEDILVKVPAGGGSGGSGGASGETCTVSLGVDSPANMTFYYTNPEMSVSSITLQFGGGSDVKAVKGTIISANAAPISTWLATGELVPIIANTTTKSTNAFIINGDCEIIYR